MMFVSPFGRHFLNHENLNGPVAAIVLFFLVDAATPVRGDPRTESIHIPIYGICVSLTAMRKYYFLGKRFDFVSLI